MITRLDVKEYFGFETLQSIKAIQSREAEQVSKETRFLREYMIQGNQRSEEVSPKYVSSSVHKFFWTKEQLNTIKQNEIIHMTFNSEDKENQHEN
ncbi:hypothetical protein Avbf_09662 [Armadillidium vulgare]|nr:hypothetical protein Avbf_09662 [Armadillidium vulgare]